MNKAITVQYAKTAHVIPCGVRLPYLKANKDLMIPKIRDNYLKQSALLLINHSLIHYKFLASQIVKNKLILMTFTLSVSPALASINESFDH